MRTKFSFLLFVMAFAITPTVLQAQNTVGPGSQVRLWFGEGLLNVENGWTIKELGTTAQTVAYTDMQLMPGGGIVVCGRLTLAASQYPPVSIAPPFIALFNRDGRIRTSWGNNGVVIDSFPNTNGTLYNKMIVQKNGKIVVIGSAGVGTPGAGQFGTIFLRYNADGTIDNTFRTRRTALTIQKRGQASGKDILLWPDGRILTLKYYSATNPTGIDQGFIVERWTSNGTPDPSFGNNGVVDLLSPDPLYGFDQFAIDGEGNIFVMGHSSQTQSEALIKLSSTGRVVASFGVNGFLGNIKGSMSDDIRSLTIQEDGKIILAGRGTRPNFYSEYLMMRLNPDGSFDKSFNKTGIVTLIPQLGTDSVLEGGFYWNNVMLQQGNRGKIIAVGTFAPQPATNLINARSWIHIARYKVDGSLDTTWGFKGVVRSNIDWKGRTSSQGVVGKIVGDSVVLVLGTQTSNDPIQEANRTAMTLSEYRLRERAVPPPPLQSGTNDAAVMPGPGETMIASVHPNPTNNSATIAFNLPQSGNVNVHIADMNGRTVLTVYNGTSSKGSQVLQADMSKLAPGMYNVVIQTGLGIKTMKLIKE